MTIERPGSAVPALKLLFGTLSLLVVLAIVGFLVRQQTRALQPASAAPGASAAGPRQQAREAQQQVREATEALLRQGAERASAADP